MANAETCPMCGQRIATYKHKLNKVLISTLFKLRDHGGKGKIDNLGLTHSEFANMQKLRRCLCSSKGRMERASSYGII